jgi:antitoxin component of MazEF toxin-antitoxin module
LKKESVDLELNVSPEGDVHVPAAAVRALAVGKGSKVHVRVTAEMLTANLKKRKVSEEEIRSIAAVQLEPRSNVVKFLATESVFSGNKEFGRRARGLRSRR